jgi:hypothetical protein
MNHMGRITHRLDFTELIFQNGWKKTKQNRSSRLFLYNFADKRIQNSLKRHTQNIIEKIIQ